MGDRVNKRGTSRHPAIGALVDFTDDRLDPKEWLRVQKHLDVCSRCRDRQLEMSNLVIKIQGAFERTFEACPNDLELTNWYYSKEAKRVEDNLEEHVASCPRCHSIINDLEEKKIIERFVGTLPLTGGGFLVRTSGYPERLSVYEILQDKKFVMDLMEEFLRVQYPFQPRSDLRSLLNQVDDLFDWKVGSFIGNEGTEHRWMQMREGWRQREKGVASELLDMIIEVRSWIASYDTPLSWEDLRGKLIDLLEKSYDKNLVHKFIIFLGEVEKLRVRIG